MATRNLNTICSFKEPPASVRALLLTDLQQLKTIGNSHKNYVDA
ncbi:hypothetical protein Goshw_010592, partial [Gossypium schwendimanii]|nr:hypothetical protein [Gossypium schwendimanii]